MDSETTTSRSELSRLRSIVQRIEYKPGWQLYVNTFSQVTRDIFYLVVSVQTEHVITGAPVVVEGRRWFLSPSSCESEVVQTALMAILAAEEHEARERFKYLGVRVFNPHINVNWLLENKEQSR